MDRAQLKQLSKQQIKGKIGVLFLVTIIVAAISGLAGFILSFIPVVGPIVSTIIVTPAFTLSISRIYIGITNDKKPEVVDTFSGFDDFWSAFKVNFFMSLFTFLWSLLFVIPGLVKAFSYSMAMYILAENKGKPALECIKESKEMMNGHKFELFVLALSFIGWILLGTITFGILYIWLTPYMSTATANFYQNIKNRVVVQEPATV